MYCLVKCSLLHGLTLTFRTPCMYFTTSISGRLPAGDDSCTKVFIKVIDAKGKEDALSIYLKTCWRKTDTLVGFLSMNVPM